MEWTADGNNDLGLPPPGSAGSCRPCAGNDAGPAEGGRCVLWYRWEKSNRPYPAELNHGAGVHRACAVTYTREIQRGQD